MLVRANLAKLVATNLWPYAYQKHNVGNVGNVVIRFKSLAKRDPITYHIAIKYYFLIFFNNTDKNDNLTHKTGFSQYLYVFFVGHLRPVQLAHNLPNLPTIIFTFKGYP
jgi:hypothetical protein